ncbi:J domain-containing protein [Rubrobacter calidifluminis]|uniref:J domain-containing protein n=1 Tax=Rubrobacter calidifluminis TaxID=1392640 RepID=UPI002361AB79|nr:J domain-containing protein [Rubrobacter calidifluminis]
MSIPHRLGRLARGFVYTLQEDERFGEKLRVGRERGEAIKNAFEAALRGAAEEWRRTGEEAGGRTHHSGRTATTTFRPRRYPPEVAAAYQKLGLQVGAPMEEVSRKRRELIKRFHPDRFPDADRRARAERLAAEINASYDVISRHLSRRR